MRRTFRDDSQVYLERNFTSADNADTFGKEFPDSVPAEREDGERIVADGAVEMYFSYLSLHSPLLFIWTIR